MNPNASDIRGGLAGLAGLPGPTGTPVKQETKMALDPDVPQLSQKTAEKSFGDSQPLGPSHGNILSQAIASLARELSTFGEELTQLNAHLSPALRPAPETKTANGASAVQRDTAPNRSKNVSDIELLIAAVQFYRGQISDIRTRLEL